MCELLTAILGTTLFSVGSGVVTSGAAAGAVAGGLSVTVGGALAGLGAIGGLAAAGISMYKSARASKKAEAAQKAAIEKLSESNSTLEVNKTAGAVSENTTKKRTLSSLRVKQDSVAITSNVYGVDSNNTVSSSSNMVGLNIAA